MYKICTLARNKETYFIRRLIQEVGNKAVIFNPWGDVHFPAGEIYLARTSGVYGNDLDLALIKELPQSRVFNSFAALSLFRSKNVQYQWMEEHDIPCLPWISMKDHDLVVAEKFSILYPRMIIKPLIGQGGWGVKILEKKDLRARYKMQDRSFLIQPLIENAIELRYFFIKGSSPMVLERKSKTGFAANFRQEGDAFLTKLPEIWKNEIERIVHLSGAHYGAIDLLIDGSKLYILELNSVPGIEQLEKVSGQNVMQILLKSLEL